MPFDVKATVCPFHLRRPVNCSPSQQQKTEISVMSKLQLGNKQIKRCCTFRHRLTCLSGFSSTKLSTFKRRNIITLFDQIAKTVRGSSWLNVVTIWVSSGLLIRISFFHAFSCLDALGFLSISQTVVLLFRKLVLIELWFPIFLPVQVQIQQFFKLNIIKYNYIISTFFLPPHKRLTG